MLSILPRPAEFDHELIGSWHQSFARHYCYAERPRACLFHRNAGRRRTALGGERFESLLALDLDVLWSKLFACDKRIAKIHDRRVYPVELDDSSLDLPVNGVVPVVDIGRKCDVEVSCAFGQLAPEVGLPGLVLPFATQAFARGLASPPREDSGGGTTQVVPG